MVSRTVSFSNPSFGLSSLDFLLCSQFFQLLLLIFAYILDSIFNIIHLIHFSWFVCILARTTAWTPSVECGLWGRKELTQQDCIALLLYFKNKKSLKMTTAELLECSVLYGWCMFLSPCDRLYWFIQIVYMNGIYVEQLLSVWSFSNWSHTGTIRLHDGDWPPKIQDSQLSWIPWLATFHTCSHTSLLEKWSSLCDSPLRGTLRSLGLVSAGLCPRSLLPVLIFSVFFHCNQLQLWIWIILSPVSLSRQLQTWR